MLKRFLRGAAVQGALVRLVGLYLQFALRSTRWRLIGAEHLPPGRPVVAAFWHERLPLMPMIWMLNRRRGDRMPGFVLASRHRDGRAIGAVMRGFGVGVVHGSSGKPGGGDKGGGAGLRRLLRVLRDGGHVIMTPDGPRGPARHAAPGVAQLAALSGAPVLPMAGQTARRRVLRSWDRMVMPLPFGVGVLVVGAPIAVGRDAAAVALPQIAAALNRAVETADRACP